MLTIREPLKLHTIKLNSSGSEQFFSRISSNYNQISARIAGTDLIHMVTQPPELFYAEGDTNSIFNQNINIENIQANKVEMLNNLINRIVLSTKGQFTYQDEVYVSNIMRKLGITNEQEFIKDIYNNINETKVITEKIKLVNNLTKHVEKNFETNQLITLNRYERNYIAGELSRLSLSYENRFFAELNKVYENSSDIHKTINATADIVNSIIRQVAESNFEKINEDARVYITNASKELSETTKNALFQEFNRLYDGRIYKDFTVEALEKLVQKISLTSRTEEEMRPATEIISEAIAKGDSYSSFLFMDVAKRLDIVNSYNMIRARQTSNRIQSSFTQNEIKLTNMSKLINEVSLRNARDLAMVPVSLKYLEQNIYEEQPDITEVTEEAVSQQLTKAILYSLIDTVFKSSLNRNEETTSNWYQISKNLYNSADNTINRFEENLIAPVDRSVYEKLSEEAMYERLERMERENTERLALFEQVVQTEIKPEGERPGSYVSDKKAARADSLTALESPDEFLERVAVEKKQAAVKKALQNNEGLEQLPPEIRERIELVQAVTNIEETGSVSNESQQIIANVFNQMMTKQSDPGRVERIYTRIKDDLQMELLRPVEEEAIVKELGEANVLFKQARLAGQNGDKKVEEEKKTAAIEILNNVEVRLDRFERGRSIGVIDEPDAVQNPLISQNILPPEFLKIVNEISINPGEVLNVNNFIESLPEETKEKALEKVLTAGKKPSSSVISEELAAAVKTQIHRTVPRVIENVSEELTSVKMIQKTTEMVDSEEIIRRLDEQKKILTEERVVNSTSQTFINEKYTTETTKNIVQSEIQKLDIENRIDNTIAGELKSIENQLFDKLESRLDNERRRRGF